MYTAYLRDFGTLVLRRMTMTLLSCYIVSDIYIFFWYSRKQTIILMKKMYNKILNSIQ